MGSVGLVFAPLAPLVALAACIVFWMGSWVYKYQLMFVYITQVETGGRLWNVVVNRLLFCVVLMQALMVLTIGLQYGFASLQWISTIPPIFIIAVFKVYINRTFVSKFRYYVPSEDELRLAKVHSERADNKGNRLEKRFGHPALHQELFTPMLHAKMMPLLSQVYKGKIGNDEAKLGEYGGQKMQAQVVEGGIKIAAIEQRDLEYDPALYRRDRGELDWDARSMASTNIFNDGASTFHGRNGSGHFAQGSSANLAGYEQYLAAGPGYPQAQSTEHFELAPIDSQNEPLLGNRHFHQSNHSLLNTPPQLYHDSPEGFSRAAPIHRPQESYGHDFANMPSQSSYMMRTNNSGPTISTSPGPMDAMRSYSPGPGPAHNSYIMDSRGSPSQQYPPQPHRQYSYDQYSYHSPSQTSPPQSQFYQRQGSHPALNNSNGAYRG
ncbi:hypothetical protein E1B28_010155 [Marasmius oreades]|uniref:CSC1/OSCA1-like 7TM region domain-containing protein n=1 Tax=Marasmius oreades TaxID=181124 RepID=A0A9P7URH6_9AGAR|nr:uncharacterized protein E1B28_010155 [Marasmius oreades]KAG7091100.1 hypothetical protein E1B28_010155 [Marasmius oreades]